MARRTQRSQGESASCGKCKQQTRYVNLIRFAREGCSNKIGLRLILLFHVPRRTAAGVSPQVIRDVIEVLRATHAGGPGAKPPPRPMPANNAQEKPNLTSNATSLDPTGIYHSFTVKPAYSNLFVGGRPFVPLPHNLGSIQVPPAAQRVDVRFNWYVRRQVTENLS